MNIFFFIKFLDHPDGEELDLIISNFQIDLVQCPFNVFDTRMIKTGYFKKLKKLNIEIHVRSIFLQGLLLMNEKLISPTGHNYNNKPKSSTDLFGGTDDGFMDDIASLNLENEQFSKIEDNFLKSFFHLFCFCFCNTLF